MLNEVIEKALEYVMIELKKEKNQDFLKTHVLDTTIHYILEKLSPYIIMTMTIFILILLLTISIIILILSKK